MLVDEAQSPGLDELVRELPMEENTALLDTPRDPLFKSSLRCKIIYITLCQSVLL